MAQMSTGGFVVLPGGFGTFEEVSFVLFYFKLLFAHCDEV